MYYLYPSGSYYEGESYNDIFNGKGKFYFNNGDTYDGDFEDDMFNGIGKYVFKSGSKYNGSFLNDQFHGIGTFTFSDGTVEKGRFQQDKRVGKFIQFDHDKYYVIIYNNDKTIKWDYIDEDKISEAQKP